MTDCGQAKKPGRSNSSHFNVRGASNTHLAPMLPGAWSTGHQASFRVDWCSEGKRMDESEGDDDGEPHAMYWELDWS
jgi:hypothetical protein